MLKVIWNANLALAFLLELAVLAAAGYWGFTRDTGVPARFVLGLGVPVALIVVWYFLGAPGATYAVHGVGRVVLEVLWFGSAVVFLALAGHQGWAAVFLGLYLLNTVLRLTVSH
jgi:uncharacterized protein DUF2568